METHYSTFEMLNRWIGILAAIGMGLANAAVFWRDVLPDWAAGDPPPSEGALLRPDEERRAQVGIYDDQGRNLGYSWTHSRRLGHSGIVHVRTATVLMPLRLPGGMSTPPVQIETELTYQPDQARVDDLKFSMHGLGIPITLHGEAMPTGEFPFDWQVGPHRGQVILDSRTPAALGDVIRPFDRLPELYVGRSWRVKLLDPLSQIIPELKSVGLDLQPVLVRVTGMEVIDHRGEQVETFVVEGGGAIAWARPDGTVLRQEVDVPLFGRLILLEEPYDEQARRRVVKLAWPTASQPADRPAESLPSHDAR